MSANFHLCGLMSLLAALLKEHLLVPLLGLVGNTTLACAAALGIAQMKILPFADESATQSVLMYLLRDLAK